MRTAFTVCLFLLLSIRSYSDTTGVFEVDTSSENTVIQDLGPQSTSAQADTAQPLQETIGNTDGQIREFTVESPLKGRPTGINARLSDARSRVVSGTVINSIGVGLYAVSFSLGVSAYSYQSSNTAVLLWMGSQVMTILGPIVSGVGGSNAYDAATQDYNMRVARPVHWNYYRAGWAFAGASTALAMVSVTGTDGTGFSALGSLALSITGKVMFVIHTVKATAYTNSIIDKVQGFSPTVGFAPTLSPQGNPGAAVVLNF